MSTEAGGAEGAPSLAFEEHTFPYIHSHDDEDGAPLPVQRCTRCGVPLLPNEHTREQGICHSCWSQELAYGPGEREERAE